MEYIIIHNNTTRNTEEKKAWSSRIKKAPHDFLAPVDGRHYLEVGDEGVVSPSVYVWDAREIYFFLLLVRAGFVHWCVRKKSADEEGTVRRER